MYTLDEVMDMLFMRVVIDDFDKQIEKDFNLRLLGPYLKPLTNRTVRSLEDKDIRVQYYTTPATGESSYIHISPKGAQLINARWDVWTLPISNFPKDEGIILYGKLFRMSNEKVIFLACDVLSNKYPNFNVDKRNRMMQKICVFLNSQIDGLTVAANLFRKPTKDIVLNKDQNQLFDGVYLPTSGLIFVNKQANVLFTRNNPGWLWDFRRIDVAISSCQILKHLPVQSQAKD